MDNENCLIWNVRGFNAWSRRNVVRMIVDQERVTLLCLQETKLDVIDDRVMLGLNFSYYYLVTMNTCGGILVACRLDR